MYFTHTLTKRIALLLAMLFMAQSVGAAVDVHQQHQSGIEHVSFDHEHDAADAGIDDVDPSSPSPPIQSQFDCHHCCHCHGVSHQAQVPGGHSVTLPVVSDGPFPDVSDSVTPIVLSTLYRPPIA